MKIGSFVNSDRNTYGIGKLIDLDDDIASVEYFDSPADEERLVVMVPLASLTSVEMEAQTRVFCYNQDDGFWLMGRVLDCIDQDVYIALPNKKQVKLNQIEVFVRWDKPLNEPWTHLETRLTETPYFHASRSELINALVGRELWLRE